MDKGGESAQQSVRLDLVTFELVHLLGVEHLASHENVEVFDRQARVDTPTLLCLSV